MAADPSQAGDLTALLNSISGISDPKKLEALAQRIKAAKWCAINPQYQGGYALRQGGWYSDGPQDHWGRTALMQAAYKKDEHALEKILMHSRKEQVNLQDLNGFSALMLALTFNPDFEKNPKNTYWERKWQESATRCAGMLIRAGADCNIRSLAAFNGDPEGHGMTVLHILIAEGNYSHYTNSYIDSYIEKCTSDTLNSRHYGQLFVTARLEIAERLSLSSYQLPCPYQYDSRIDERARHECRQEVRRLCKLAIERGMTLNHKEQETLKFITPYTPATRAPAIA